MTNKIFNEINEIYHDTSKDYLRGNINCVNKLDALKILCELFNNINDDDFNIIFNKYISKFKSSNFNSFYYGMKLDSFDNVQTFLSLLRISIDYTSFKEFSDFLLNIKELIFSKIYNKINQIYNNNNNFMIQNYNENKVNALKILLNLINNKNDDEVNILFNKYINKYKFTSIEYYHYGGIIIFDTIESFLLILEQYNISNFFKELSNNLLKTKEQIEIDSVKIESVKKEIFEKTIKENIDKESVKKESVKKESVKKESVKKESVEKESVEKESVEKKLIKNESVKKNKKTISATVKRLVWNTHIGEDIGKAKCTCCNVTDITQMSFHCGHIIAEVNGGDITVSNLKPICQNCNSSMGTKNMNDFMQQFK